MQGYSDPLFRNIATPFIPDPPSVPREYNPTGSYRKSFTLPKAWKDREIFLRLEKTASASFVWVNGQEVGYNEGAQEPAEYNITQYLKPGRNTLAVNVHKYSDGYYLEDQDYWRLAGIFDDVWLFAAPKMHIFDWFAITDLDESFINARLDLSVEVKNYSGIPGEDYLLRTTLFDSEKKTVQTITSEKFSILPGASLELKLSDEMINPAKWSAEYPNLYTLVFELVNPSGKTEEVISGRIGFKETGIRNQVFYLNGVPVKLNGTNTHMQHPTLGHTMNEETMIRDFNLFKQYNINCVRTSHYPPVSRYLELADEYGIYIVDETGDECHATQYLSELEEWEEMYRERARKMVLRDRNHPSILFWSAGNESGEGMNICHVIDEGKKYDPTRYWMYGGNAFAHPCEDIIGPRYPQLFELITNVFTVPAEADPRPSFMDEYQAVTGNGGGGLDDYWEAIHHHPRSMGGAIWDFVSTGMTEKVRILQDGSPNNVQVNIMGRAKLTAGITGKGIDLNGHDQWVEVYRDEALEISGNQLTLSLWVYPRALSSSAGTLLTKGNYQFGIHQIGKDSLEFYLTTNEKHFTRIALPQNWEYNWHKVEAVYTGSEISLFIDGEESKPAPVSGNICNTPFPVNVGRNVENHGQGTYVYICDAIIDEVGIFPEVVPLNILDSPSAELKKKAALWLDFEDITEEGEFFSYGIGARTYGSIWPDRRPQPEMLQIKKSGQPVNAKWVSPEQGEIEITNHYHFTDLGELNTFWMLQADDKVLQKGVLDVSLEPGKKKTLVVPFKKPELRDGAEYRLLISFRQKEKRAWADAGYEIAWDQLELPWYKAVPPAEKPPQPSLTINDEESKLSIAGKDFAYVFDKNTGALSSMQYQGKELIREGGRMNAWRAPLANETDEWTFRSANIKHNIPGFGGMAATEWYSSGLNKLQFFLEKFSWERITDQILLIDVKNVLVLGNQKGAFHNHFKYTVHSDGEITIEHNIIPNGNMPSWLPRMGTEWVLDKSLDHVKWYGRGPEENYPDRKSGYKTGIYESTVNAMVEPYLIPQDYGLRTDNRWVKMLDENGTGLMFKGKELFNFSVHPFSTENLTKALYTYQLHPFEGITFNFDYATSGLGCTARSVFTQYQVPPKRYDFILTVKPVKQ
jgi:beta-galactosidase